MTTDSPSFQSTVLIVDDEALFRTSAVDALELAFPTYRIVQAANGKEALDHIAASKVDVVVTDVSMPIMGGLELMLALRERKFRAPVIVVTAFGDPRLESKVSLQGAFGYLEKPVNLQQLIEVIRAAAEGEHSHIEGLTLAGFVQLLALERKTCRLRVSKSDQNGDLLFQDGVLVDAKLGRLSGDDAALQLLAWEEGARLDLHAGANPRRTTVTESLNHLLLEAMRLKDEESEARGDHRADADGDDTEETSTEDERAVPADGGSAGVKDSDRPQLTDQVEKRLKEALSIVGAIGIALVDHETDTILGRAGDDKRLSLDVAGIGNTTVVRAKLRVMKNLGLDDEIEDILISLNKQYHLIRPLATADHLFLYLALDRDRANLALARHKLMTLEKNLVV